MWFLRRDSRLVPGVWMDTDVTLRLRLAGLSHQAKYVRAGLDHHSQPSAEGRLPATICDDARTARPRAGANVPQPGSAQQPSLSALQGGA